MSMRSGEVVGGLLVGALAGAVLGLLLAPEAGEEVRQRLKERASEYKDRAASAGAEWVEKGTEVVREKKEQLAAKRGGEEEG
ncbi:MAG: YtxH domain-containing protein [Armatimonadota bacterium]|nr:MAG: YtxH domain-containing protein [Armatimonadota bacterium]